MFRDSDETGSVSFSPYVICAQRKIPGQHTVAVQSHSDKG